MQIDTLIKTYISKVSHYLFIPEKLLFIPNSQRDDQFISLLKQVLLYLIDQEASRINLVVPNKKLCLFLNSTDNGISAIRLRIKKAIQNGETLYTLIRDCLDEFESKIG